MTVKEIVVDFLIKNKLDGLCHEDGCACKVNDLMPCFSNFRDIDCCETGTLLDCEKCKDWEKEKKVCDRNNNFCVGKIIE